MGCKFVLIEAPSALTPSKAPRRNVFVLNTRLILQLSPEAIFWDLQISGKPRDDDTSNLHIRENQKLELFKYWKPHLLFWGLRYTQKGFIWHEHLMVQDDLPDMPSKSFAGISSSADQRAPRSGKRHAEKDWFQQRSMGVHGRHSLAGGLSLGTTFKKCSRNWMHYVAHVSWNQTKFCCYDCRSSFCLLHGS